MNACTCACTQYKGLGRKYRTVQSFRKSFKTKHVPGQPAGLALRGLNEDIGNGARTSNVREQASTQPMQHAWLASLPVQISYITTYVKPFPAVSYIYIYILFATADVVLASVRLMRTGKEKHASSDEEQWLLELLTCHRSASRMHRLFVFDG